MGSAVVSDDVRVIDRDVCGALLEVTHWVTTRLHDFFDQPVGFANRFGWLVHEPCLSFPPSVSKSAVLFGRERANLEFVNALLARSEFCLGFTFVAILSDDVLVKPRQNSLRARSAFTN